MWVPSFGVDDYMMKDIIDFAFEIFLVYFFYVSQRNFRFAAINWFFCFFFLISFWLYFFFIFFMLE